MLKLSTIALVFVGVAMSQPVIRFSGLEAAGVRLLPSASTEFKQALDPSWPTQLHALLPYAALIKNETDQPIIGYTIRWNANREAEAGEFNRFDFSDFSGVIAPHEAELVWGPFAVTREWSPDTEREVERQISYYSKQQTIVIRLEAVLFRDGTAVGFDTNNWITRWKAYIDSERQVYEQARKTSPGELRATMMKLVDSANKIARPMFKNDINSDRTRFSLAVNNSGNYSVCLSLLKGLFAVQVIGIIDESNEEMAIKFVSGALSSKNYPTIHRKEI